MSSDTGRNPHSREVSGPQGRPLPTFDMAASAASALSAQQQAEPLLPPQPHASFSSLRSPAGTSGVERQPSVVKGHYRQGSKASAGPGHSRNPSFVNSPTTSPLSPQLQNGNSSHIPTAYKHPQMTATRQNGSDPRLSDAIASTLTNASTLFHSLSSTSTLVNDRDASMVNLSQRRTNGPPTVRMRIEGSHSHSRSKDQQSQEQKTVGDYALHHLFDSFVGQADGKINRCTPELPDHEPHVESILGQGADTDFDQLISALGHIARQRPKPLIDIIMYWRKAKGEVAKMAKQELSQSTYTQQRTLPRRNTEPPHMLYPDSRSTSQSSQETSYPVAHSLQHACLQAERRSALSIYLLCRVLIQIYNQTDMASLTRVMHDKLEEIIFDQLRQMEPDQLFSSFSFANWNIYCDLLGAMSRLSLRTVSQRFVVELHKTQKDLEKVKGTVTRELEWRITLMILALKHIQINISTENGWTQTCDLLRLVADLFVNAHGAEIKYAYCKVLEALMFPVAAVAKSRINSSVWKDLLIAINSRLSNMVVKPRHWVSASGLSAIVLCASAQETFANQWFSAVNSLQPKLKDRATRPSALQAVCRLVWTYVERVTSEPTNIVLRKLEDVIKITFPHGKKTFLSSESPWADPKVELIRIIGFHYPDFCFRTIVFPLLNSDLFVSGKETKAEQLDPERTVIGIRAFLAIIGDLETGARPPFPRFQTDNAAIDAFADIWGLNLAKSLAPPIRSHESETESSARPINAALLNDNLREYYAQFCEILGRITLICDNAFGGQAVIDEKIGGLTPKTPISDAFSFSKKEDPLALADQRQGFYDLLQVAVEALPRCFSAHVPFNSLINLMCTGTAHVRSNIASSSARSLKSIASQGQAQSVTIGFARFIFNFDARYLTMSDDAMLGPGHIENTLQLYVELLRIWIEDIQRKTRDNGIEQSTTISAGTRSVPLDLTSLSAQVEEIESHGMFFLCSQSRRVRLHAVKVLQMVTEFDLALGKDHPRIIDILEGDARTIVDFNDEQLTVAERSRLQKGAHNAYAPSILIDLCSSDGSYDATLWSKVFPKLIKAFFEICPLPVTLAREKISQRLLQMRENIQIIANLGKPVNVPIHDANSVRGLTRPNTTPPDVVIEQWKLYLIMACTTMTNVGALSQQQLANLQHTRKISNKTAQNLFDKSNGYTARSLFGSVISLLSAPRKAVREATVIALGSININLYRTLLESLQYAVTKCKEEAKLRVGNHQRTGSTPHRSHETDLLRTEVTHVYKLTSRFLREAHILREEWILENLTTYTRELMIYLSDAEVQSDWECQRLRRFYCGLLEELYEAVCRTNYPLRWMAFESRKSAFTLMEDWCGYSPNQKSINQREYSMKQMALSQQQESGERTNVTAAIEIEKRDLRTAALSAMAALCAGPIRITTEKKDRLSFDVRRMLSWIDSIFKTESEKIRLIGRRALEKLIVCNYDYPSLLEHAIEMCYVPERPEPNPERPDVGMERRGLEDYFEVITRVLTTKEDYPFIFWRILGAVLFTLGNAKPEIRMKSAKLLRELERREQKNSKIQEFDINISDKTTAVYKLAQFKISQLLASEYPHLAFFIFSQFSLHFRNIDPDHQRNMVAAILPWIQTVELQVDPGEDQRPTTQSYMILANMLEITTKVKSALHNEVQALWQALATGPYAGNVGLGVNFVIALCLDRKEQAFIDYAKQIIVYLSSTPAGSKVVEFLLGQITPKTMVQEKREPIFVPNDSQTLPYIADLSRTLPMGCKQHGFAMAQLCLIFLVDLMVAPIAIQEDDVILLLQTVVVSWDHYIPMVQGQAREMLVHLIHELVITKIDDNATTPNKVEIEGFVEAIRRNESSVVWNYDECNGKDDGDDELRVPTSMKFLTIEVINLFSIAYPRLHEKWAKKTLEWSTSCPVRHVACRSFQVFRCVLNQVSPDASMLANMLNRLSNTIAEETSDYQTFSMEILSTLKAVIGVLTPQGILNFPQLFWATCACLDTIHEREFLETLGMLSQFLDKVDLSDPAVVKIIRDAKPKQWKGDFGGVAALIYKGFRSTTTQAQTLALMERLIALPDSEVIGDETRLLIAILANLPCFLRTFEPGVKHADVLHRVHDMANVAEARDRGELANVLNTYATKRYSSAKEFLRQLLEIVRRSFFPQMEFQTLHFLLGLLSIKDHEYKVYVLEVLCALIPSIDSKKPEIASCGPDLITPLLRLLQTEYCPQALQVMDHLMVISAVPMDKHLMRMSMAMSSSKSVKKEYERTMSLYGIPEETGWSIPAPAIHSSTTRDNVQAVFQSCLPEQTANTSAASTPGIKFHTDEYGSKNGQSRSGTFNIEEPSSDVTYESTLVDDGDIGDLVSKLDSLDDFFEDNIRTKAPSNLDHLAYSPIPDTSVEFYDNHSPVPSLGSSFAQSMERSGSNQTTNNVTTIQPPSKRDPPVMNPAAFALTPNNLPPTSAAIRPSLHSRSITSPANSIARAAADSATAPYDSVHVTLSDNSTDEASLSEDELATGGKRPLTRSATLTSMLSSSSSANAAAIRARVREGRTRQSRASSRAEMLRTDGRAHSASRSRSRAPGNAAAEVEVPKVPEKFLGGTSGGGGGDT